MKNSTPLSNKMQTFVLSGADGTGKSTQAAFLIEHIRETIDQNVILVWKRHMRFFAKLFNLSMRITGRNRRVSHNWGVMGYHDYDFMLGYLYILLSWIDWFLIAGRMRMGRILKPSRHLVVYDRHLPDLIADLILATNKQQFVFRLFDRQMKRFVNKNVVLIVSCSPEIARIRRPDLCDDELYFERDSCYLSIAKRYNIKCVSTSDKNAEESFLEIIDILKL